MNLYQVDINTEIDAISVLVNAYDENEALAIAQTMFTPVRDKIAISCM